MNKHSKGFTLIELVIVVGIIGVLAAIAIPSYTQQVEKARRSDAMDALLDCAAAQARNFTSASPPSYLDDGAARAANICNNMVSKEGFYTIVITNPGCEDDDNLWCFLLTAMPVANRAQAGDGECAFMSVDHRSNKRSRNAGGDDTSTVCWRS